MHPSFFGCFLYKNIHGLTQVNLKKIWNLPKDTHQKEFRGYISTTESLGKSKAPPTPANMKPPLGVLDWWPSMKPGSALYLGGG